MFDYGIRGGGYDLRTYTLDQFYHKHLLGWNIWTRSNEGYDLARYFGTWWTFYPHPHQPYIVFYQNNWETTEFEQLPRMHPAWLLTHRKNTRLILPRSWGGRKRRIFIPPPSLQTSTWWFAASWVGIALFRIGITPVNLEQPFVHKTPDTVLPKYAVFIGWGGSPSNPINKPLPMKWNLHSINKDTYKVQIMYRWWWDDGSENYLLCNPHNRPVGTDLTVVKVDYPYYILFFGAQLPTGISKTKENTDLLSSNPVILPGQYPNPVGIWWYRDRAAFTQQDNDKTTPMMDTRYLRPQDLPDGPNKVWVMLTALQPGVGSMFDENQWPTTWTTKVVKTVLDGIVQNSPFVMGKNDIPYKNQEFNILARYSSHWQWGGIVPRPDTVQDPETLTNVRPPTTVRNPATVGIATLHPWDLTQGGTINEHKLRSMLTELLTPPDGHRPDSPEARRKKRKRPRQRPPATPSESDESDAPPNSSKSGTSSEGEETPTPPSSESETDPEESPPPKRLFLRRRPLLR